MQLRLFLLLLQLFIHSLHFQLFQPEFCPELYATVYLLFLFCCYMNMVLTLISLINCFLLLGNRVLWFSSFRLFGFLYFFDLFLLFGLFNCFLIALLNNIAVWLKHFFLSGFIIVLDTFLIFLMSFSFQVF